MAAISQAALIRGVGTCLAFMYLLLGGIDLTPLGQIPPPHAV
jgi:hypothetical protein